MRYTQCLAAVAVAMMSAACNNDIFVKPLEVSSTGNLIAWDGGECVINSNIRDFDATISIMRVNNGEVWSLTDIPVITDLDANQASCNYSNPLFDIDMKIDSSSGRLSLHVGRNYYQDTIFIVSQILTAWDNTKVTAAVLPAPEFNVGNISYDLSMWSGEDTEYVEQSFTYGYINGTDKIQHHKVFAKGQILSYASGYFHTWESELSNAIFENREIYVPTVYYKPSMISPVVSSEKIVFSTTPQRVKGDYCIADEDFFIDVPPGKICHITLWIKAIKWGFEYTLPATSPDDKATVELTGRYWLRIPQSYTVNIEFQQ